MNYTTKNSLLISNLARSLVFAQNFLTPTEMRVYSFIESRTLGWRKLVEKIPAKHITDGLFLGCAMETKIDKREVYRARKSLDEKNVVLSLGDDYYMINIPGILRIVAVKIKAQDFKSKKALDLLNLLSDIIRQTEAWMREKKIRIRTTSKSLDKIEQDVKAIEKQKLQARKRKGGKEQAWALFQTWIDEYIEEYWPDGEVKQSKNWTGKTRGQAKNWLKSFDETGGNAREWIRQAIERWPSVASACRDQYGRPAPVSTHCVRFSDLYTRREEIERILAELKDRPRIHLVYDSEREAANE